MNRPFRFMDAFPAPFQTIPRAAPVCSLWWYWWPDEWRTGPPEPYHVPLAVWRELELPAGQCAGCTPYYPTAFAALDALAAAVDRVRGPKV